MPSSYGIGVTYALGLGYCPPLSQEVVIVGFSVFIIALVILYAALYGIFVATLYAYAKSGQVPSGFQSAFFEGVFTQGV